MGLRAVDSSANGMVRWRRVTSRSAGSPASVGPNLLRDGQPPPDPGSFFGYRIRAGSQRDGRVALRSPKNGSGVARSKWIMPACRSHLGADQTCPRHKNRAVARSSCHGPGWLSGGTVGPEGSVLVFVVIAALFVNFDRLHRQARYPLKPTEKDVPCRCS